MSENLQNLLKESLLNNSYDYSSMHDTLRMTWENSYSYLYNLQKNYVEFEDFVYVSSNFYQQYKRIGRLYTDKLLRACFNVNYDFINISDREKFHESEFYYNEFTFYDMINNKNIFKKIPIIIVDSQCIWDYKIKINNKYATIILPFNRDFVINKKRHDETDELVHLDHTIRVLIIDNIYHHEFTSTGIGNESNINENFLSYYVDTTQGGYIQNGENTRIKTKYYLNIEVTKILEKYNIDPSQGLFIATINKNVKNKKNLKDFFYGSNILISSNINYNESSKRYLCSFLIGDNLYENIFNQGNEYVIHVLYIDKLHNYQLPINRHRHSFIYDWYANITGLNPHNIYNTFTETDGVQQVNTQDIVCDETSRRFNSH